VRIRSAENGVREVRRRGVSDDTSLNLILSRKGASYVLGSSSA
jgi:hypothetical protein